MSDYKWYINNSLDEYSGKWVAISKQKVVGANEDFRLLIKEIKKRFDTKKICFARIPQKDVALVYLQC